MILSIAELSERNPWWVNKEAIWEDQHIMRALASSISWRPKIFSFEELKRDAIYTLRGPRQVGKTTYLKFLIADILHKIDDPRRVLYLSCDPLENRSEFWRTLLNYLRWVRDFARGRLYIILDEVTRIEDWQIVIKDLADHNYLRNSVIIACGSHSLDVKRGAELLPGRRGNFVPPPDRVLYPMSFKQFVNAYDQELFETIENEIKDKGFLEAIEILKIYTIKLERLFNKYLITGGFPSAVASFKRNAERHIDIHIYIDIAYYIKGDIIRAKKNPELAKKILNAIIETMGNPTSINKISREAGCDPKTTQEYIDTLESMYILFSVPLPDPKNWIPLERKRKKIYLTDPFLVYVSKYMLFEDLEPYYLTKKTLEQLKPQILELIVGNHIKRITPRLYYWRTKQGREIDYIYTTKNNIIGIEIKETPKIKDAQQTHLTLTKIPKKHPKTTIITGQTRNTTINTKHIIIPIQLLLYTLDKLKDTTQNKQK